MMLERQISQISLVKALNGKPKDRVRA